MAILLFSDGFETSNNKQRQQSIEHESSRSTLNRSLSSTKSESSVSSTSLSSSSSPPLPSSTKLDEKLHKIQQNYVEIAYRYLHDEFGVTIGCRMFQNLLPLLFGK
jgi:hypothetical protein